MLALPTIQKRMRRFERHQKAVFEAGELFNRASFARTLFMPRAVGLLSAQSYLLSSVASSTPPTQSNFDHTQLISPKTNNKSSSRLSPIPSPLFLNNDTARRKSLALISSPSPRKQQRRPSQNINPSIISSATHALSSACVSAVAAVSVSESPSKNETIPRRCRFSSFAETKEYDVDSEDDKRSQVMDEIEDETEDGDEDEESGSDEFFDDEDFSSEDRSNNFATAKQLFSKVGTGIQNAAAAISSKHRLSLAEPNLRGFKPAVRKLGMNQASSARNSFLGQSTPQALGLSSLMPLLASHESFRRCSDSVSQNVRSNSTAGIEARQIMPIAHEKPNKIQNNSRPFSTSPTVRPETWQTLTPRTSPAIFTSPTHSASLMPHRESDTARSTISTTNNSYFSFSTCPSVNSLSISARSSINTSILNEELVLTVENFKSHEIKQQIKEEILASILSPTETTTTTIPGEPSTPLASPSKSPTNQNIQEDQLSLEQQNSTIRRSHSSREKIWEARAKFFRTEIHSKSPLMLRRFVLDVENDPLSIQGAYE